MSAPACNSSPRANIEQQRIITKRSRHTAPFFILCLWGIPPHPLARVLHPRAPASRSARVRRRAPFHGGRLACRAVTPYHVVKMRRHSFAPRFNENYPLSRSFSLRVVGVTPPHPLARGLSPRAPILFVCNPFPHSFCQGIAPKVFACGGIIPPHPRTIAGHHATTVVWDEEP